MTCCHLIKTTGRTEVTIPDPPNYPPIKPIPKPPIPGGQIPDPFGGDPPEWGSGPVPSPTPGGSGPGGGDSGCNTCYITLSGDASGIVIPPECCRVIIIHG